MKKPLLSVCLITYNHAEYIREAIDSILMQQTDFAWQLIIADDYSTDGTREILAEYKEKYPERISLLLQKRNVGPEKNWLELMAQPKTTYVLYTEGDDYITDASKFQKQVDFLEANKEYSLCFHPVKITYEDGSNPDEQYPTPEFIRRKKPLEFKHLLETNFIQTNSVMYRWRFTKESLDTTFPKGVMPGDWVMHLLHAETGKIGFINKVMAVYRRHPGGLWWQAQNSTKDTFWKKYGLPHLFTYSELLRMYGGNNEHRQIVLQSANRAIAELAGLYGKGEVEPLEQAMSRYPENIKSFLVYAATVLNKKKLQDSKYEEEIAYLTDSVKKLDTERDRLLYERNTLRTELERIKQTRTWKIRSKATDVKKIIRR